MSLLAKKWISDPAFQWFKKVLPPLSQTEQEALAAGSVWWDAELFSGHPNFTHLHQYPKPSLTEEERHFLDNEVQTLLSMLDDYQIVNQSRDLPQAVWDYLASAGFFSLIIAKEHGGKQFSSLANSTIVSTIATHSISAAVTVMVPNSLGPGELLSHYGTEQQKNYWLPRLASGEEIPCFALTAPEAGSDAGAIADVGVVSYGEFEGKQVLGIKLTWNKRYITLAPVATVIGLAFKLQDPEHLLGDKTEVGISCALIPSSHQGVEIGDRHDPLGLAFMNGPTRGNEVFIPLDWLIGGVDYAGKGWRMLVECLSAGRGISLPALGAAIGHLATRTTGAYAYVRKQFGLPIGKFEGVAQVLGRIGGLTYLLEATRTLTTTALDLNEKPAIVTAISKYHMTEIARGILNDAMDIHAGKAIQGGPNNYLTGPYMGTPIAITVEGANILTRNLIIFGQGATRCHPYVLKEMAAADNPNEEQGAQEFHDLLFGHIKHALVNGFGALGAGLTGSFFIHSPIKGATHTYYRDITRLSRALAISADVAMLTLGGELKRKEMLSARLGDVLSHLYMASAVLKRYEDDGRQQEDLNCVHYAVQYCLHQAAEALLDAYQNYPKPWLGRLLKWTIFPLGQSFAKPKDELSLAIAQSIMTPGAHRDRLTHLCYLGSQKTQSVGLLEAAFVALYEIKGLERRLHKAIKQGEIAANLSLDEQLVQAQSLGLLSLSEVEAVQQAEALRHQAIQVDHFSHDYQQLLS